MKTPGFPRCRTASPRPNPRALFQADQAQLTPPPSLRPATRAWQSLLPICRSARRSRAHWHHPRTVSLGGRSPSLSPVSVTAGRELRATGAPTSPALDVVPHRRRQVLIWPCSWQFRHHKGPGCDRLFSPLPPLAHGWERGVALGRHCRVRGDQEVQSWPPARRLVLGSGQVPLPGFVYITCFLFAPVTKVFPDGSAVKNPPASAGDSGNSGSTPRLGRSPGEAGNPLVFLPGGASHGRRGLT